MILLVIGFYSTSALALAGYLTHVGRRPWSWQRKLRAPEAVAAPYYYSDASVGAV